ncbi:MAG: CoA transferase [Steroidobacteraceae bacterium]
MTDAVLTGIRIIEVSTTRAAATAAMLLAEAGADVIKVSAAASRAAAVEPGFAVWDRSKRSVILDLAQSGDRDRFDALLRSARVFVHDIPPRRARQQGLDDETLSARFPRLIITSIGGYPAGHPRADDVPVHDAMVLAESGLCTIPIAINRAGPVYMRFPLGTSGASYLAACGIVARLIAAQHGAPAGSVRTSLLQGALIPAAMHWYRAERPTESLQAGMPRNEPDTIFQCSDGQWIHVMSCPDGADLMQAGLAQMSDADRERCRKLHPRTPFTTRSFPNWQANVEIFQRHAREPWLSSLRAADVAVDGVEPLGKIYFDEQARINGYVVAVDDPVRGRTLQPGPPISMTPAIRIRNPAPRPGTHQDEVFATSLSDVDGPASLATTHPPQQPLAGLKVLDFGSFLAGPLGPMLLADLGATVIKVEMTSGDPMRWLDAAFVGCQRGKRSLALSIKDPASKAVLERLVRWSDVVHHNQRLTAARKLGLDYETLATMNPDIVYCHVSSYGPLGPRKDWPGYDQMFQSSCGWELESAGGGNAPRWVRFGMLDHQCALASVLATLLGLYMRHKTGKGQAVTSSLLGASVLTVGETIVRPDGSLTPYPQLDSMQLGIGPHDRMYQCRDGWIEVLAAADRMQEIYAAAGVDDVSGLARWMAQACVSDALALVRHGGAQAVQIALDDGHSFFASEDNRRSGLIAQYSHPLYGRFEHVGRFWDFGNLQQNVGRAPPLLGQHSCEILREFSFTDAEIDALIASGTVVQAAVP